MNNISTMENKNTLNMGENLTVQEVGDISQSLKNVFDNGMGLAIDLSEIRRIDSAGVQLLCAIFKEAKEKKVNINWIGYSKIVVDATTHLGLTETLNIVPVTPER